MRDKFCVSGGMVVNNHFSKSDSKLSWIYAFSSCTVESVAAFDGDGALIAHNNRFGTLDSAGKHDLVDINSLFRYYSRYYKNTTEAMTAMRSAFNGRLPVVFTMNHYAGWSCHCRAYPVIDPDYKLGGVMLLAHRKDVITTTRADIYNGGRAYAGR